MSADPFRDIVKKYAHLYRDSEDCRVKNFETRSKEYIEWKKLNDVYEKAMQCLKHTETYMKNTVEYVEAPNYNDLLDLTPTVFLGGGITNCKDWQKDLMVKLESANPLVRVYNPRRKSFDISNPNDSQIQIDWEHYYLNVCDILVFYFASETLCPITLFELGGALERNLHKVDHRRPQKVLVYCEPEYQRKFDVNYQVNLVKEETHKNQFAYIYSDYNKFVDGLIEHIQLYNNEYIKKDE